MGGKKFRPHILAHWPRRWGFCFLRYSVNGTPHLSPQQLRALNLAAHGLTNQAIAQHMGLATCVVSEYLAGAYRRLGAVDRANAVFIAQGVGLIKFDAVTALSR